MPTSNPVIGVLSQSYFGSNRDEKKQSYIAASYVKFLESAGARVIPVLTNQSDTYYEEVYQNTNGILIPGGGQNLINSTYTRSAKFFIQKSLLAADAGNIYPIWATCLGFEQMIVTIAQKLILTRCDAKDIMSSLIPTENWKNSEFINSISIKNDLIKNKLTYNFHGWCLTEDTFYQNSMLRSIFKHVASSIDSNGLRYVALIENAELGWTGVQFHPEKAQFEFKRKITHNHKTILFGQETANYFVNQCKKSKNEFSNSSMLIYNYSPTVSNGKSFEQIYLFDE